MSQSLLETLPQEVLHTAADYLDSDALINCRLVNRRISNDLSRAFSRRFFRHRAVFMNLDSLNTLCQVSRSEKYRALVTSLDVCVHHLPDMQGNLSFGEYKFDRFSIPESDVKKTNDPYFVKLLRDQKWLMETDEAAGILTFALKNLPNCTTIRISDITYDGAYCRFQKFNPSGLLTTTMFLNASRDFVTRLISTTVTAIHESGRIPEVLHIDVDFEGIYVNQLPRFSAGQLGFSFSKLSSLTLNLRARGEQDADLLDWIKLFPSLTFLDLSFSPDLFDDDFPTISQCLHIDGLTTLRLCFVKCNYYDLALLLKKNRKALRSFLLFEIDLIGGENPWRSILETIRDETLIDSIKFDICRFDDKDISFGIYYPHNHLEIPTEGHNFSDDLNTILSGL